MSSRSSASDTTSHIDDEHQPTQRDARREIAFDEHAPARLLVLGTLGESVPRQIDEHHLEPIGRLDLKQIELPRGPRRGAGANQTLSPDQRVEQARFSDIGAPGESNLGQRRRRNLTGLQRHPR